MKPILSVIIAFCLLIPAAVILVRHLKRMVQGRGCEQCGNRSACAACQGCSQYGSGANACRDCPHAKK